MCLKLPVLVNRLDSPVELFTECFREKALDGYVELLGEDHGEARIDVVLIIVRGGAGFE